MALLGDEGGTAMDTVRNWQFAASENSFFVPVFMLAVSCELFHSLTKNSSFWRPVAAAFCHHERLAV